MYGLRRTVRSSWTVIDARVDVVMGLANFCVGTSWLKCGGYSVLPSSSYMVGCFSHLLTAELRVDVCRYAIFFLVSCVSNIVDICGADAGRKM